jgi:hypothetical protein
MLALTNAGASMTGVVNVFSLTGSSGRFPAAALPRPGDNFAVIDLRSVGVRMVANALGPGVDAIQFAINTWGERSHPNTPAEFDIYIDVNNDGTDDYVVANVENGGPGATGQNLTVLVNLATNQQVARFFTDADLNSANAIFTILRSDVAGLGRDTKFRFSVYAFDNYYTGQLTDAILDMQYTPGAPRFSAADVALPANGLVNLGIARNPAGDAASPSQTGLLLMHRDARTGFEADAIAVQP